MNTIKLNTLGDKVVIKRGEGGGKPTVYMNDVTFYDYDGTILYSYKADEFLALTELPKLDDKEGLKADGWNWTLEDAKEQVMECGMCDIGAHYVTDTGETRVYIDLVDDNNLHFNLHNLKSGVLIDWGDGNSEMSESGKVANHDYKKVGQYIVKLTTTNEYLDLGGSSSYGFVWAPATSAVKRIELGNNVKLLQRAFEGFIALESVSLPSNQNMPTWYLFDKCRALKHITMPNTVQSCADYCFSNNCSMTSLCLPKSITSLNKYMTGLYSLKSLILPIGYTSTQSSFLSSAYSLQRLSVPSTFQSVNGGWESWKSLTRVHISEGAKNVGSFYQAENLYSVKIPSSLLSVPAFSQCSNLSLIDISAATSVIPASSSFSLPSACKVVVPDALYDEWIAATKWSGIASKIIKKSDWDASQS